MTFKIGDSVIVTTEGKDPEFEDAVCITWDSLTLKSIPAHRRDSVSDVRKVIDKIGATAH